MTFDQNLKRYVSVVATTGIILLSNVFAATTEIKLKNCISAPMVSTGLGGETTKQMRCDYLGHKKSVLINYTISQKGFNPLMVMSYNFTCVINEMVNDTRYNAMRDVFQGWDFKGKYTAIGVTIATNETVEFSTRNKEIQCSSNVRRTSGILSVGWGEISDLTIDFEN